MLPNYDIIVAKLTCSTIPSTTMLGFHSETKLPFKPIVNNMEYIHGILPIYGPPCTIWFHTNSNRPLVWHVWIKFCVMYLS